MTKLLHGNEKSSLTGGREPLFSQKELLVLAIPLLALYNGRRGKNPTVNRVMKWLFYIYYPLHLFILGLIQLQIR